MHRLRSAAVAAVVIPLALTACGTSGSDGGASGGPSSVTIAAGGCDATGPTGTMYRPSETAVPGGPRDISTNPEGASGYRSGLPVTHTKDYGVATANPIATKAACEVLEQGGSAADALVAAQTVLGLVEPQSSGIAGGAFLLYYDAKSKKVQAYDGRETAPASADENYLRWISPTDRTVPQPDARSSGRAIGVPGALRLLEAVHGEHGSKTWRELFDPAVRIADDGFEISPRLAGAIADEAKNFANDAELRGYFLEPDGAPKKAGVKLTNPAYAKTLGAIASEGAKAFYTGPIAEAIVASVRDTTGGRTAGTMTVEDLARYAVKTREAVCTPYRDRELCGMPAPSSGGITVAQALGILNSFDLSKLGPDAVHGGDPGPDGGIPTAEAIHLISEAERLAYADRDKYIADPDFIPLPGGSPAALVDPAYLEGRAKLIDRTKTMGTAKPGEFPTATPGVTTTPEHGTSHITVLDKAGNVASMTTTVESAFGSYHMVDGFLLNNQLTDFSAEPIDSAGQPVANRVQPNKRPRSSMSPTILFGRGTDGARGDAIGALGSPGGAVIIQYVIKTIIGLTDWKLNPQQAVGLANFGAANSPKTNVDSAHPTLNTDEGRKVVEQLRTLGHTLDLAPQVSGLSAIVKQGDVYAGGADPRREGVVLGGS
ncbi:gamma-glutamyltransferase family protein [Tsukamurella asaccharolytica]|uniref:Gamma-glutamyltransferase family protein n=1 Tax=Tsukamurella asaccharolytica TaxID=2592067 RepID=A0A5C5R6G1_9ACTN|nr:gamma-glutamyltransferase family protein [Tsukamurella asaccharolytica]TWS18262.1 gamma-glutamyltransferase family protein [Tsukamurella asaccharolytica]